MVQTQIILAVVGAIIMLSSAQLAARSDRRRCQPDPVPTKIEVKDAVVLLSRLAVGLRRCGLYALSGFRQCLCAALWVIESSSESLKRSTQGQAGDTDALRPKIEAILRKFNLDFELRTSSDEELYDVQVPLEIRPSRSMPSQAGSGGPASLMVR